MYMCKFVCREVCLCDMHGIQSSDSPNVSLHTGTVYGPCVCVSRVYVYVCIMKDCTGVENSFSRGEL